MLAYRVAKRAHIDKPLPVFENASIPTAMLVGLWRPVLLVPQGFAENPQAPLVLLHEYTHARRGDLAKKLVLQAAVCLHRFNPAVWWLNRCAQQEIELACDEGVLAVAGANARANYGQALLGATAGQVPCFVSQFGGGKRELKMRLTNLFRAGKRRGGAVVVCCLLAACLTGLLVACGVQKAESITPAESAASEVTATTLPDTAPSAEMINQGEAFLAWMLTSDQDGRYMQSFLNSSNSEGLAAMVQTVYYDPAAAFATPDLLQQLTANRLPVHYDSVAVQANYTTALQPENQSYTAAAEDELGFAVQLTLTADGTTTTQEVSGTLWFDTSGGTPLVRAYRFTAGWPVDSTQLAALLAGQLADSEPAAGNAALDEAAAALDTALTPTPAPRTTPPPVTDASAETFGIRYTPAATILTYQTEVSPAIAAAIDYPLRFDPATGKAVDDCGLVMTDITLTNLQNTPQDTLLTALTLHLDPAVDSMGIAQALCYVVVDGVVLKDSYRLTLAAGESKTITAGFLTESRVLGEGQLYLCINPDGTWPPNNNARLIPITVSAP